MLEHQNLYLQLQATQPHSLLRQRNNLMAFQNPLMSLITLLVLLLLSVSAHATDQSRRDSACSKESIRRVTKDVLALSIREIRDTRKFVQSIPRLKSIRQKNSKELLDCVVGLIDCVSDIRSILNRMRHLKANLINSDTNSLRGMASRVLGFNQTCNLASKGVDGVIVTMLDRKLANTVMLINNVVNVVSRFQLEATATVNP